MSSDKDIKGVLRRLEYGVYIVTMGRGADGNAFTASWITQVSSEPPLVALAVHNKHQSSRLIRDGKAFVVNLLASGHAEFARTYYGPAESGYQKLKHAILRDAPVTGTPILNGVVGWLECRLANEVACGNHTLFIGEAVAGESTENVPILTSSASKLHYLG